MGFTNNMTKLINKIEIRLGTRPMNLPPHLCKDKWADVITDLTISTWSRYYPLKMNYTVHQHHRKGEYYLIDEAIADNAKILGIRDLNWGNFTQNSSTFNGSNQPYGMYDMYSNPYNMDDFMLLQTRADQLSLFNNGMFPEFVPPNKIAVKNCNNINIVANLPAFNIELLIEHNSSLSTISPTQMETFENLAQADVATFLYQELKLYDNLETVFANIDLKLDELRDASMKREEIVNILQDSYISAGNSAQPMIFTI